MGKGRMLLISGIITALFVIIGAIALAVVSEESPLDYIIHKKEEKKSGNMMPAENAAEEQMDTEKKESLIGNKEVTDETGIHHILFESGKVEYTAISGPVKLTVTQATLEEFIPASEHIKNAISGQDRSTIAFMNIEVENNGEAPVYFRIDDAKVQSDTKEISMFHPALSTQFDPIFAPNERKQGTVAMDFESEILDIAVIEIMVASPFDENYDPIGKAVTLKVPMY